MTLSPRLPASVLLPALLFAQVAVASAAERVRVPSPWIAGQSVAYDDEALQRDAVGVDGPSTRRITDRTEIRVESAGRDGIVLAWTTHDSRVEAVDGDRVMADLLAPVLASLDEVPVVIELDGDGRYRRVRDLDALAGRVRAAMLPAFLANLERTLGSGAKIDKLGRDDALEAARRDLQANMDTIVSRDSVEAGAAMQQRLLSAFVGKTLVAGRRYTDREPIRSPIEGRPLPGLREYTLEIDRDDPALARIRWTHRLDAGAAPAALWSLAKELGADALGDGRPADLALEETGTLLFRRDTGVVELLQTDERSKYGAAHDETGRHRMRRVGAARTWAQEEAARQR